MTMGEAVRQAMWDEMTSRPECLLIGEAITSRGGASKLTYGFADEFGASRVFETPISENALVGAALGAALAGIPVICEVYSADFLFCAGSEVFNDIAKWRYMHQWTKPMRLVLRMPTGSNGSAAGPEHCQALEGYLHHAPGLRVVVPGDAETAYVGLRGALGSGDPVIFLEHRSLYARDTSDRSSATGGEARWHTGEIARPGDDVTIVAWGRARGVALEAAERVSAAGISAEVIDPVSVKPMNFELIAASLERTRRLVVVEDGPRTGSVAAEIFARSVERFGSAEVRMERLTMPDVHHPFPPHVEQDVLPTATALAELLSAPRPLSGGSGTRSRADDEEKQNYSKGRRE